MDSSKFAQFVREFPFLTKVFAEGIGHIPVDADSISYIEVERGDRNLLEVTPSYQANDAGSYGEYVEYRRFWCVSPGKITQLANTHWRTIPYHRNDYQDAAQIGAQLHALNRHVQFIVEVSAQGWDWEDRSPSVTIYKMQGVNWRKTNEPKELTAAKAFVDESFTAGLIDEIKRQRKTFLSSLVPMQSIICISLRNGEKLVGLYVRHDDKSITISRDGKEMRVANLDMSGSKKL